MKSSIETERKALSADYATASLPQKDSLLKVASILLTNSIVDSLMPYWYGTTWDFNGYTNTPNKGTIACGYLVSTTLKHAGIQVNRYRLAQQSALNEIRSIESGESKYYKTNTDVQSFLKYCESSVPDGLYLIGLDNHVGYLLKKGGKIDFIHSSYLYPSQVVREPANQSTALAYSTCFYLGRISNNKGLLKKWILGQTVTVQLDKPINY